MNRNTLDTLVKKKLLIKWSAKKVMLTAFWNMKETITIGFLEQGATVNSASYCHFLWQNSSYLLNDPHKRVFQKIDTILQSNSLTNFHSNEMQRGKI